MVHFRNESGSREHKFIMFFINWPPFGGGPVTVVVFGEIAFISSMSIVFGVFPLMVHSGPSNYIFALVQFYWNDILVANIIQVRSQKSDNKKSHPEQRRHVQ